MPIVKKHLSKATRKKRDEAVTRLANAIATFDKFETDAKASIRSYIDSIITGLVTASKEVKAALRAAESVVTAMESDFATDFSGSDEGWEAVGGALDDAACPDRSDIRDAFEPVIDALKEVAITAGRTDVGDVVQLVASIPDTYEKDVDDE